MCRVVKEAQRLPDSFRGHLSRHRRTTLWIMLRDDFDTYDPWSDLQTLEYLVVGAVDVDNEEVELGGAGVGQDAFEPASLAVDHRPHGYDTRIGRIVVAQVDELVRIALYQDRVPPGVDQPVWCLK